MDYPGVFVLDIVSPKELKRKLIFLGVSSNFESSLSLTSILPWLLVVLYNPADATSFAPTDTSEALFFGFVNKYQNVVV